MGITQLVRTSICNYSIFFAAQVATKKVDAENDTPLRYQVTRIQKTL